MKINIPVKQIGYTTEQLEKWKSGDRGDCKDSYCLKLRNSYGFGEYIAGKHFEREGYEWIHHDFNLFGGNKLGKYPKAEEVFIKYFGEDRYHMIRNTNKIFNGIEEPDLLLFKDDLSEIRFIETKRADTRDKFRESQIVGLALLSFICKCPVSICEIINIDKHELKDDYELEWEISWS